MNKTWLKVAVVLLIVILTPLFIAYKGGYRIGSSLSIVKTGTIAFEILPEESTVFLDNKEREIRKEKSGFILPHVSPGTHMLLVAQEGFWPWAKEITIKQEETTAVSVFLVPHEASEVIIPEQDPEYNNIIAQFNSVKLPTVDTKKISDNENVAIWNEGQTVFAEWLLDTDIPQFFCTEESCEQLIVVFESITPIRSLDFYKDRSEILIIAVESGISALEIDKRGIQNFQPIYKGKRPVFVPATENTLYIQDNKFLFLVNY